MWGQACLEMKGSIPKAARRPVENKLRSVYVRASKPDKERIIDEMKSNRGGDAADADWAAIAYDVTPFFRSE